MSILLHLSGVPAAGKSHFGRWLESNQRFVHIDAESDDRLNTYGLNCAWAECFRTGDVVTFRDWLTAIGKPVVLDNGSP